jgi:hypothetical protein
MIKPQSSAASTREYTSHNDLASSFGQDERRALVEAFGLPTLGEVSIAIGFSSDGSSMYMRVMQNEDHVSAF